MKCIMPWVYLNVMSDGSLQVCPMTSRRITDSGGRKVSFKKYKLENIFNSHRFKEIRQTMLSGDSPDECGRCRSEEKLGAMSKRQLENKGFEAHLSRWDETGDDGSIQSRPLALNIALGNTCNLACRMCRPEYSSHLAKALTSPTKDDRWKEFLEIQEINRNTDFNEYQKKFLSSETILSSIKDAVPDLQGLWLHGGEPTLSNVFDPLMKFIIEQEHYKHLSFGMTTNLTRIDWLKYADYPWENLTINFSMDGVGDVLEYIRYPIKWSLFEQNLKMCLKKKNVEFQPCITLSALNVHDFPQIVSYLCCVYQEFDRKLSLRVNLIQLPKQLRIENLPIDHKKKCIKRIQALKFDSKVIVDGLRGVETLEKTKVAILRRLQSPAEKLDDFYKFNESLDIVRDQSLAKVVLD